MQPDWLSNAYVLADREGGTALFVDSGAELGPLVAAVEAWDATPAAVVAEPGEWTWGDLRVRGIATPGHSDDMVAFVVDGEAVFTGDTLFKDAVGGGDLEQVRSSVMDVFMTLPDELRVLPGHTDETTIGRERESNPFVRVWRGAEPEGTERVQVGGREATLVVWSPDYDGKGKAWVRFDDGTDAIVGGSRVER